MSSNTYYDFLLERIHFPGTFILDEPGKTYTCGRGKENQIICLSLTVSRQHCSFFRNDHEIYVIDLGSSNGIFVNEIKQEARHMVKLNDNDIIGIGCPNSDMINKDMFIYKVTFIARNKTLTDEKYTAISKTPLCKDTLTENIDKSCHSLLSEHDVNKSFDLVSSNEISELSKNITESCQIKTLNKKIDNGTKKINSNQEIKLINTCSESNTIQQNITHLDTNHDNKYQKKNDASIHKNLSKVNSKESALNKTFQTITEKEVICIDLSNNIHTKIVQKNNNDKTKDTRRSKSVDKKICHENNAIFINDIDDASVYADIGNNIKIQQNYSENMKTQSELDDDLKKDNKLWIKESGLKRSKDGLINIVHNGNYLIKMKDKIIIEDDGKTIENSIKNSNNYTESTIKLKQVNQEPKLRFSEIDIVNFSDDEENVFPCSQLFDSNMDVNSEIKKEIKQEYNDNHDEDINRLDDTEIIISLSDSEDEDNIWLHRLSRSQLSNDTISNNDKMKHTIQTIKDKSTDIDVIDEDVKNIIKESNENINDALNLNDVLDDSIETSRNHEIKEHKKDTEKNTKKECTNTEHFKNSNKLHTVKKHSSDVSLDARKTKIDDNIFNKEQENNDKTNHSLDKKQSIINNNTNDSVVKHTLHSKKIKSITRKRPQIIDAPHMPVKKKRGRNTYDMDSYTTEDKLKEDLNVGKGKKSGLLWSDNLGSDKSKKFLLSKEEKKKLIENRKNKLKQIAAENRKVTKSEPLKLSVSKPIVKVSLKSRSDFLIDEIRSKKKLNKPSVKKSVENKKCKDNTVNINTRKDINVLPSISHLKIKKQIPSYKETLNNVTKHLQQSLSVTDGNDAQLNEDNKSNTNLNKFENMENDETFCTTKSKSIEATTILNLKTEVKTQKNVKMQKENRSPNRQVTNQIGKKKKSVSFNNCPEIHEYEIEPQNILKKLIGKDAPIPVDKLSFKRFTETNYPKIEQFLLRIFFWNPVWLEEQQYLKQMPPILKENELHPMLTYYKSYNDYYKIAEPLLLLEIWYGITKEFEMLEKNVKRPTMMCSIMENSFKKIYVASTNIYLSSLAVQVLVTKENLFKQIHPNYGDLVFFEYIKNEKGKYIFQKVFAYVTSMNETIITSSTKYNKDLENHVKGPYALLTYTIITRNVEENFIIKNRIQRIRTVTYLRSNIRMIQAIQYLPQSPLINLILYPKVEAFQLPKIEVHNHQLITKVKLPKVYGTQDKLNQIQLEAVSRVTGAVIQKEPKICLIQGPPGTGKSKVIVNIITEILYGNNRYQNSKAALRILVCAPSNAAIDEIVLRLLAVRATIKQNRFKMVRIGKTETMHLTVKDISLTELGKRDVKRMTANYSSKNIPIDSFEEEKKLLEARINSLKCEIANSQKIDDVYKKYLKLKLIDMNAKYELLENHKSINEMNTKELAKFQRVAERRILECADIITCTLSSCYTNQMESIFGGNKEKISVCIVDEATQSCEAENLIPLLLGVNTLVLVGDPNQLPATIISQQAKKFGLDQSLFSRIQNAFQNLKNNPIIMLTTQYRMAYAISYFPNKYFYGGKLKNEVENILTFPFHNYRVFNINSNQNTDKFSNTNEAEFISNIILCMMNNITLKKWEFNISIGVLTPYNNQKYLISEKINEKISALSENIQKRFTVEINTVDSFQGQERDIILMSCVRSHGIGFLSDPQRLCVALTRAKHSLILCGNFNTLMRDQMWNALISDSKLRKIYFNINSNASLNEIKQHIIK